VAVVGSGYLGMAMYSNRLPFQRFEGKKGDVRNPHEPTSS
jgi:hypothetical protein